MENNQNNATVSGQAYTAPKIEIIDIEMGQNILGGSIAPIDEGGWL